MIRHARGHHTIRTRSLQDARRTRKALHVGEVRGVKPPLVIRLLASLILVNLMAHQAGLLWEHWEAIYDKPVSAAPRHGTAQSVPENEFAEGYRAWTPHEPDSIGRLTVTDLFITVGRVAHGLGPRQASRIARAIRDLRDDEASERGFVGSSLALRATAAGLLSAGQRLYLANNRNAPLPAALLPPSGARWDRDNALDRLIEICTARCGGHTTPPPHADTPPGSFATMQQVLIDLLKFEGAPGRALDRRQAAVLLPYLVAYYKAFVLYAHSKMAVMEAFTADEVAALQSVMNQAMAQPQTLEAPPPADHLLALLARRSK